MRPVGLFTIRSRRIACGKILDTILGMKNSYLLFLSAFALITVGCSDKPSGDKATSSYYLGHTMGQNLRKQNLDIDQKEVVHGLRDGLNGEKAALNEAELSAAQQAFTRMAAAKQQELQNKNQEAAAKFLEENKKNPEWKTTASGLQYKILKDGAGKNPTDKDTLKVHYVGTLVDGTKFDSSRDRTAPAEYKLGAVIKGLREALGMMKKGSHWVVLLPPDLAYGPSGNGPIPPSAVLMYDLELIDIQAGK